MFTAVECIISMFFGIMLGAFFGITYTGDGKNDR